MFYGTPTRIIFSKSIFHFVNTLKCRPKYTPGKAVVRLEVINAFPIVESKLFVE